MKMFKGMFVVGLILLSTTTSPAQAVFQVFPQIADGRFDDGTYYQSTVMVVSWFDRPATCALRFYGMVTRLNGSALSSTFTIYVPAGGVTVVQTGGSTGGFQKGHATLECNEYVYSNVLYSYFMPDNVKAAEATVFGSLEDRRHRFVLDSRGGARLGIAIANNTDFTRSYYVTFYTDRLTRTATVQVPARRALSRFVDEFLALPADAVGLLSVQSVDGSSFSAIGLRYTGQVFTTIPAN
jgi:hypothetical protein